MNNVPNLRFQEFSDEWKKIKLGDKCTFYSGGTPLTTNKNYYDGNIPFIRSAEISSTVTELSISEDGLNNSSAKMVKKGDLLYALYGATSGEVSISKIDGAINQAILCIQSEQLSLSFLEKILRKNKGNIINTYLQGGQGNLSSKIVQDLRYYIPTLEEQEKIASFFSLIDKKIELQTEKVEELKNYKKGIMQKLFPRNGEDIPELRFTGYINDWEHRKISDIFPEIKSGNRLPKTSLSKGTIPYVIAQVTNNGIYMNIDVNTKDYHGNSMKLFNVPCITLSIDNPKAMFIQTTPFYTSNIMRILHNSELELEHYHFILEQIKLLVTYFDWSFKFSGPVIMESKILVPINAGEIDFNEIKKIGSMILQFNNLIDLHQCKLDALIKYKKGLLQQMFI